MVGLLLGLLLAAPAPAKAASPKRSPKPAAAPQRPPLCAGDYADDDYEPGHLVLSKVLADPAADIALLKARKVLPILPYRIGRSTALRPGNLVQVRGFPLRAFPAVSVGKVVNPYTEDTEHGWSHSDLVVNGVLSGGT